ncbi:hypothetical protein [Pseudogemmobacter bohemicus]|uniref:hypothetical protein n=1 Tax=Pseudogemmobacter bohemicus TaxID=2250708 RepID=UPI000DD3FEDD|nr:hypothetical protein [Pseudogemmobacter bohemicus]
MAFMGVAFTAISGFFAKTVVGKFLGQALLSFGLSALSMALAKKPQMNTGGITGDQTMSGETTPQRIVMGYTATGGTLLAPPYAYDYNNSKESNYLTYFVALADFPINEIVEVIVDGKRYGLNPQLSPEDAGYGANDIFGRSLDGQLTGWAYVKFHDGRQAEADATFVDLLDSYPERPWTNEFKLTGTAYAAITFIYHRDVFTGAPEFRFVVKGASLYDPRFDSSVGGSGSQRWADQTTWQFSDNPAVASYNILRGIPLPDGSIYGNNAPANALPLAPFFNAMNIADEDGTQPDGEWFEDTKRYRIGLEFGVDQEPNAVLDTLLVSAMGKVTEYGGYYSIGLGPSAAAPAVVAITDEDIIVTASRDYSPFVGQSSTYNGITASFPDPESLWESREATPFYNTEWEVKDGKRLVADLKMTSCFSPRQVRRVMREALNNNRRERTHVITLPPAYLSLIPLQTISWTSVHNGYVSKIFEITDKQIDPETLAVVLYLRESDPADYDFDVAFDSVRPIVASVNPVDFVITGVDGVAASPLLIRNDSGNGKRVAVKIEWNPTVAFASLTYEIKNNAGEVVEFGSVPDVRSGYVIVAGGILPSSTYTVRLLGRVSGRDSEWSSSVTVITPSALLDFEDFEPDVQTSINGAILAGEASNAAATAAVLAANNAYGYMVSANTFAMAANTFAATAQTFMIGASAFSSNAQIFMLAANTARAGAVLAANTAAVAASNANASAASAANSASLAVSARNTANGYSLAAANSATAAAAFANASGQSASIASAHMLASNTARAAANTFATQAAESASNAAGFAATASTASGVAASSLTDLQRALASTTAIINGRASTATLPFGPTNLGTIDGYTPSGASNYSSDADGVYFFRSASSVAATVLRGGVPSADGKVYRVTARIKSTAANDIRLMIYWLRSDGTGVSGGGYGVTTIAANAVTTISATFGRLSGGLVNIAVGNQTIWNEAAFIRFGVANVNAVAGSNLQIYEITVEDLTDADQAARQAESASISANNSSASANNAASSANNASTSANLASISANSAVNAASIATVKANEAGTYASEALDYRNTSARLMSGGVSKNPVFNDWTGTYPANLSIGNVTAGAVTKVTSGNRRYINTMEVDATNSAVNGPLIQLSSVLGGSIDCSLSPKAVLVRMEIEYISGDLANSGSLIRGGWQDSAAQLSDVWLKNLITPSSGIIQKIEVYIERPATAVPASATSFALSFFGHTFAGGHTAAPLKVRIHRFDFEEVLENSTTSIYQQAVANLNGITSGVVGLRAVAGSANAALELIALSSPTGTTSSARIAANNIILDGSVRAQHLSANSVNAGHINVTSLSAISATIGILRTATSGARQEIHTDRILIYDANNVLRVRMGNLT